MRMRTNVARVVAALCALAAKDIDAPFFQRPAALLHRQRVRISILIGNGQVLIEACAVEDIVIAIENKSAAGSK